MYLFIFESIGTSELMLIGAVALIIFGPRKLPQMARTLGKAMAEFKNTTNEFKSTWEREANFEEFNPTKETTLPQQQNSIQGNQDINIKENLNLPEIKEVDAAQFNIQQKIEDKTEKLISPLKEKQNWL